MTEHKVRRKYMTISATDQQWGLAVTSVGFQSVSENESYPPQKHPSRYLFSPQHGRILHEYQLLYITKGQGRFMSKSMGVVQVKPGDMFLLFPGEWHNYSPDADVGWNEYWVGFNGGIVDNWVKGGFFRIDAPVMNVGLSEELISLYKCAILIAEAQEANYQQALAGIVCNLMSMAVYMSRNRNFEKSNLATLMNVAKVMVHENFDRITPEEMAASVCMGYSKFRKIFKEYTGFSPLQYIQEVKMGVAKEMLTNTSRTIKEIAYELGYENKDYFFTVFRKLSGMSPLSYRKLTQGAQFNSDDDKMDSLIVKL